LRVDVLEHSFKVKQNPHKFILVDKKIKSFASHIISVMTTKYVTV